MSGLWSHCLETGQSFPKKQLLDERCSFMELLILDNSWRGLVWVWGTLWGWLYSAPWGSFPLQNAKSGTSLFCILLASLCNIPCSLETISDFLQTRKFIRKIRKILYLKSAFQIIWWHSSFSSKFWFLGHFSMPMDMQGLGDSEELGPLPWALFFQPETAI